MRKITKKATLAVDSVQEEKKKLERELKAEAERARNNPLKQLTLALKERRLEGQLEASKTLGPS